MNLGYTDLQSSAKNWSFPKTYLPIFQPFSFLLKSLNWQAANFFFVEFKSCGAFCFITMWWECVHWTEFFSLVEESLASRLLLSHRSIDLIDPFEICVSVQPTWCPYRKAFEAPWEVSLVQDTCNTIPLLSGTRIYSIANCWLHRSYHYKNHWIYTMTTTVGATLCTSLPTLRKIFPLVFAYQPESNCWESTGFCHLNQCVILI